MTLPPGPADETGSLAAGRDPRFPRDLTATRETWRSDDWWLLEAALWRPYPRLVASIAGFAPPRLWKQMRTDEKVRLWRRVLTVVMLLLQIGVIVAVIFAVARSAGWLIANYDRVADVGEAGLWFGAVAVFQGWALWDSRRVIVRDPGLFQLLGLLLLVPSLIGLVGALAAAPAGVPVTGWPGVIGIVASVGVGAVELWLGVHYREADPAPTLGIDVLVSEISARRRGAVSAELVAAVDALVTRGLISAGDAAAARSARLGHLGLTMTHDRT